MGVDWKAIALIITALIGAGGAVWNTASSYIDKMISNRTQAGAYEKLADSIESIYDRLDKIDSEIQAIKARQDKRAKYIDLPVMGSVLKSDGKYPRSALPKFEDIQFEAQAPMPLIPLDSAKK